jgi:hypothetical protein
MSGWQDLNLRPSAPKADAIPGYATPRILVSLLKIKNFCKSTTFFISCNFNLAVREGFEPSVQFPVRQFSKLLLSASQSPHQLQKNWSAKVVYYL